MIKSFKILIALFVFTALIFFHSLSFSQEREVGTITSEKNEDTVLVFSTQGLDKDALNVLMSENLPIGTFVVEDKNGVTIAVQPRTSTELTSVKGTNIKIPNVKYFVVSLKTIMEAFKGYKVDQIEVWVTAIAETGNVARLLISAKGEGGFKVILKPK